MLIPALLVSYVAAAEAPAAAVPPEAAEMARLLGIGAVLTLYAALAPGRGTPPLRTRSNLLAPFSDREQADDLERRFRSPGQRRQPLQRVLAGGELGDRRHLHLLRRQHPRADSIALTTGASLDGRALARNGAVTLGSNKITSNSCAPVAGEGDGGVASLSCCDGAKLCGGTCANLQTDANNCGSCGKHCSASEVCSAGACAPCPASRAQCKDQCADLGSDPFNCGACGNACAADECCHAGSCGKRDARNALCK